MGNPVMLTDDGLAGRPPGGRPHFGEGGRQGQAPSFTVQKLSDYPFRGTLKGFTGQ